MSKIHLLLGPVGAGKSTYARGLRREHGAVHLDLDAWMARLFGEDERPETGRIEWYVERKDRCLEQIWETAQSILDVGTEVILELGLVQRNERDAFYGRVDGSGYELCVYLLDAPREVRRARVERRNAQRTDTFAMEVPMPFFELASDMWQPPDEQERHHRKMRLVETDSR